MLAVGYFGMDLDSPLGARFALGFNEGGLNRGRHHADTQRTVTGIFLISLALVIIAILGALVIIPVVTKYAFWIAILGYIVLALGCLMKGV